jgi:hypothetical protein
VAAHADVNAVMSTSVTSERLRSLMRADVCLSRARA